MNTQAPIEQRTILEFWPGLVVCSGCLRPGETADAIKHARWCDTGGNSGDNDTTQGRGGGVG